MNDGEMEDLRFFAAEEIDMEEISPPIRPVMREWIRRRRLPAERQENGANL
jgi:hypothetical protein